MMLRLGFALAFLLSVAGNAWQLYHAGGAKAECQTVVNAQAAVQDHAAHVDQHQADVAHVDQVKQQAAKANQDEASDAGEMAALRTRLATKDSTIQQLKDQLRGKTDAKPFDPLECLDAPMPAALLGGLQQPAGDGARP